MAGKSIPESTGAFEQLHAIQTNDERALRRLYGANYPKVEAFVLKNSGSQEQARDVFQEAFIAVWRNIQLDKFRPQGLTSLDAYLFRIAKNKWMDYLRSAHHTRVVPMSDRQQENLIEETLSSRENDYLQAVRTHFRNLGSDCRKILTLFYCDNAPLKDIALQMGWTEATAKNNKYRCIQKLRSFINKPT
ncbi:MAG TPA: sigma-70 family RNA polymerase sigma factor [Chitinophagaceae bacterium]|nr:sigma-70 family RNA polymerase sigma factor [Chitinophagaceae bacterium]